MNNILNLENRKCPVCNSKNYSIFYKNDNYSKIDTKGVIYRYKHILVICNYCNLVYSNPWLGYKNTNKIYSNSAIGAAFEDSNKAKKHYRKRQRHSIWVNAKRYFNIPSPMFL